MSQFKDLVRQSKLLSLPPRKLSLRSSDVPRRQVLETTAASQYRHDWGLKAAVPAKAKSKLLVYGRMDTPHGTADLNYNANFARKVQKFNELGVSVSLMPEGPLKSMFEEGAKDAPGLASQDQKQRRRLLKSAKQRQLEYKAYLKAHSADQTAQEQSAANPAAKHPFMRFHAINSNNDSAKFNRALDFMGLRGNKPTDSKVSGIGLSYELKGAARNTPDGIFAGNVVGARDLSHGSGGRGPAMSALAVAVAGFVGRINSAQGPARLSHVTPVTVQATRAAVDSRGVVNLNVKTVSDESAPGPNYEELPLGRL